ncbi:hypothetical protein [uncultured Desulfovibrio sp.]|uniref:hypothetical protein n=1 Tax=uncultured Desulfovibrio sp. TaxID=167968 RepID=UPI00261B59DC|nr:hypothetical protein [uncultured Desulfovibrio sp.]
MEGNRYYSILCKIFKVFELEYQIRKLRKEIRDEITVSEFMGESDLDVEKAKDCFDSELRLKGHPEWRYEAPSFHVSDAKSYVVSRGYGGPALKIVEASIKAFRGK